MGIVIDGVGIVIDMEEQGRPIEIDMDQASQQHRAWEAESNKDSF